MKTSRKLLSLIISASLLLLAFPSFADDEDEYYFFEPAAVKVSSAKVKSSSSNDEGGRNALYITADTAMSVLDFSSIDFSNLTPSNIDVDFTWKLNSMLFMGLDLGMDYNSYIDADTANIFNANVLCGLNLNLKVLRPYGFGSIGYTSDEGGLLKAGAGLDIKLGSFLLTAGWTYNWKYDISEVIAGYQTEGSSFSWNASDLSKTTYHTLFVGAGLTW